MELMQLNAEVFSKLFGGTAAAPEGSEFVRWDQKSNLPPFEQYPIAAGKIESAIIKADTFFDLTEPIEKETDHLADVATKVAVESVKKTSKKNEVEAPEEGFDRDGNKIVK